MRSVERQALVASFVFLSLSPVPAVGAEGDAVRLDLGSAPTITASGPVVPGLAEPSAPPLELRLEWISVPLRNGSGKLVGVAELWLDLVTGVTVPLAPSGFVNVLASVEGRLELAAERRSWTLVGDSIANSGPTLQYRPDLGVKLLLPLLLAEEVEGADPAFGTLSLIFRLEDGDLAWESGALLPLYADAVRRSRPSLRPLEDLLAPPRFGGAARPPLTEEPLIASTAEPRPIETGAPDLLQPLFEAGMTEAECADAPAPAVLGQSGTIGRGDDLVSFDLELQFLPGASARSDGRVVNFLPGARGTLAIGREGEARTFKVVSENAGDVVAHSRFDPGTGRLEMVLPVLLEEPSRRAIAAVLHLACERRGGGAECLLDRIEQLPAAGGTARPISELLTPVPGGSPGSAARIWRGFTEDTGCPFFICSACNTTPNACGHCITDEFCDEATGCTNQTTNPASPCCKGTWGSKCSCRDCEPGDTCFGFVTSIPFALALEGDTPPPFGRNAYRLGRIEDDPGISYLLEDWAVASFAVSVEGRIRDLRVDSASSGRFADHVRRELSSAPSPDLGPGRRVALLAAAPEHPRNGRWIPHPRVVLAEGDLPVPFEPTRVLVRLDLDDDRSLRQLAVLYSSRPVAPELVGFFENQLGLEFETAARHRAAGFAVLDLDGRRATLAASRTILPVCCCQECPGGPLCDECTPNE